MNPPVAHAELIATFRRAEADAAHKFGLIQAAANKGPKAIQAATETAAKAAKRRDSFAKKLGDLGVTLKVECGHQSHHSQHIARLHHRCQEL